MTNNPEPKEVSIVGVSRLDMEVLKNSAQRAAIVQWGALDGLRTETKDLEVWPLSRQSRPMETLGVVAADAGLVSVELAPFSLEFLFVADSLKRVHLAEIFPLSALDENLEAIFHGWPVLQRFTERIELSWGEIRGLWKKQVEAERLFAADVRLVADTLRELAEWAVCCELAMERIEAGASEGTLILHDGLLRSWLFRSERLGDALTTWWRRAWEEHGVALAGVGKSSLLWQRLALALDMDPRVLAAKSCAVPIPGEMEEAMTGRTMSQRLGFGRLLLVKTALQPTGLYLPVDLPEWILSDRASAEWVLGVLGQVSETSFPRPGYPAPLGDAHEMAHLTDFDARVIRDRVVESLREMVGTEDFEKLLRMWAFQPPRWQK